MNSFNKIEAIYFPIKPYASCGLSLVSQIIVRDTFIEMNGKNRSERFQSLIMTKIYKQYKAL